MSTRRTVSLSIAGVPFRIKTNTYVPLLYNSTCSLFRNAMSGSACSLHLELVENSFPGPSKKELQKIGITRRRCVLSEEYFKNPILSRTDIIQRIKKLIGSREEAYIAIGEENITIHCFDRNHSEIYFTPSAIQIIQNTLRFAFYSNLILHSATSLHSSGIIRKGRAALFVAESGGGKSTVVDLASDGTFLLNEDCVIIRNLNGNFNAFSNPFGGRTDGPNRAEIAAFFILKKGDKFSLSPHTPLEVIARAWDDNYILWGPLPLKYRIKLFSLYYDMFSNIPVYLMEFPVNFVDWDQIDSILSDSAR